MRLAENESRRVGMKFEALVVMRLKFHKRSAMKLVVELSNNQSLLEIIPQSGGYNNPLCGIITAIMA
jgi:hypothetical protein